MLPSSLKVGDAAEPYFYRLAQIFGVQKYGLLKAGL